MLKSTVRTVGGQPGHDGDRRGNPDFCPPNQHVKKSTSTPEDEIISDINPNRDANDVVAADPSAVAAACRAGEELERRKLAGSSISSAPPPPLVPLQLLPSPLRRRSSEGEVDVNFKPQVKIQLEQAEESPTNNDVNLGAADESPTNNDNVNLDAEQPSTSLSTQKSRRDDTFHFHGPRSVRHWIHQRRHRTNDDPIRSYVKGKVIDRQHELFIMSIAIMLGMRTSIGKTNRQMAETSHDERRWLDNDDLMAVEKYVFPPRVSRSDFCSKKDNLTLHIHGSYYYLLVVISM